MKKWYAIRVQTDKEMVVKETIEQKIKGTSLEKYISRVLVPMEKVSEIKAGKKRVYNRKIYPGYILVEAEINDETRLFFSDLPYVLGFVGTSPKEPIPLTDEEISKILAEIEYKKEKSVPKVNIKVGDSVRIKEGSFENFEGVVESIDVEKGILTVMVPIFGRSTPVELEFWQVEPF